MIIQGIYSSGEGRMESPETKRSKKLQTFRNASQRNYFRIDNPQRLPCRVCYSPEEENDPFLDLCSCMKTNPVHLSCTKQWLSTKTNISKT